MQKLVPVVQIRSGEQRPAINGLVNSDGRLLAWYACPGPPARSAGNCYEIAHLGVGSTPDRLGLLRECGWTFPLPPLLSDAEAKKAYDRLASAKFQKHDCATHRQSAASLDPSSFTARARSLIMRGFKPKDAAEITMQEIIFEFRDDPDIARRVQIEAKDFLQRVKEGLI